jgi:uncharacterized HhH-GPD family protein
MNTRAAELRDRLVATGEVQLLRPPALIAFAKNDEADALLNDLKDHPHAFLFGCLVDRGVPAEKAWMVPSLIRNRLGSFEINDLAAVGEDRWRRLTRDPEPAHRYPEKMAVVLSRATERIVSHFEGDASRIWKGRPTSATLVRRLLEFHGAGPKIATMAGNILVRDFKVVLSDTRFIDISADVHVRRVMARLGFVEQGSGPNVVVYAARDLNPDYPGIFDGQVWRIGHDLCRPKTPMCSNCELADLCSHACRARGDDSGPPTPWMP